MPDPKTVVFHDIYHPFYQPFYYHLAFFFFKKKGHQNLEIQCLPYSSPPNREESCLFIQTLVKHIVKHILSYEEMMIFHNG